MFRNLRFMILGVLACMLFILLLTGFSAHRNVGHKLKEYWGDSTASDSVSSKHQTEAQQDTELTGV